MNTYLIHRMSIQSNRLTEGLSRISSQLFEDQYEYVGNNEIGQKPGYQAAAQGFSSLSATTFSLPLETSNSSLYDYLLSTISKLYWNIILYLDSDNWIEEINQSKISTFTPFEKRLIYNGNSIIKKLKLIFKSRLQIKGLNNTAEFKQNFYVGISFFYSEIKTKLKTASNVIFPIINRFI